jgi:hypothetical protein
MKGTIGHRGKVPRISGREKQVAANGPRDAARGDGMQRIKSLPGLPNLRLDLHAFSRQFLADLDPQPLTP